MDRPPQLIATASGVRATCAANNAGIDTDPSRRWVNTARLPISSSRACSPCIEQIRSTTAAGSDQRSSPPAPLQPPEQRLDAGRVEHVGVVFDANPKFAPGPACTVNG